MKKAPILLLCFRVERGKEMDKFSGEANVSKLFCLPLEKGSSLNGKVQIISFFPEEKQTRSHKFVSLLKMAENPSSISRFL